ncbi:MAG: T9SS type A sorting domain-containing protein [Bacteroidota bacterium]
MQFDSVSGDNSTVFYSFLLNVQSAPASPTATSYIVGFWETTQLSVFGAVYLKHKDATNFNIGISRRDDLSQTFSSTDLAYNSTYLVVVKYKFVNGIVNDVASIYVSQSVPGTEPGTAFVEDLANVGSGTADAADIAYVLINQESGAVDAIVDAVRVGTTWSDAPLPVQLTNFAATSSRFGVDLQWSTATELNNYGFDIERRSVGSAEATWSTVGFVQGAGTSTSPRDYSYTDSKVDPGRYAYRIKQIDMNAAFTYYSTAEVEVGLGPKELALEPNYPNPFNPSTNITFTVPVDGRAALKVYNMLGQEVATLFDEEAVAGRVYQKTFDASSLPTGVYVSRLEFGGQSVMRKMLFVK